MKTVFKEGMKVYDQVNFPGKEGVIIDTNKNNKLNLLVKFDSVNYLYTLKGIYLGCNGTPTLSTKPYEIELKGFEQKAPAKTYEEALEWLEKNSKDRVIYADETYVSEEYEFAFEALKKLIILRDYYNEGWQANWNDTSLKHIIYMKVEGGWNFLIDSRSKYPRVLHFKSEEIAKKFIKEQKELLEIAKPLL
ncbi:hypothetical protein [Capnocytophaga granulosa]|uniref:hypothetical protein n=1 Tax=Capnocytophaga granulosa TaxID=45242 RepID=UPI003857D7C9